MGNGEVYVSPVEVKNVVIKKKPPVPFAETVKNICNDINQLKRQHQSLSEKYKLRDKLVATIRVHPDYLAKSYYPLTLFRNGFMELGSRDWAYWENGIECHSKMYFVGTSVNELDNFSHMISGDCSKL